MNKRQRQKILRKFPTALCIVTTRQDRQVVASVISFITQTSLEPALIILAIRVDSRLYRAARDSGRLAIHFADTGQQDMVAAFFRAGDSDEHFLNGYAYELSPRGVPLLKDSPMIIETQIREIVPIGDHHIFITETLETHLRREVEILTRQHTNWQYGG